MKLYFLITLFGLSLLSHSCKDENDCCSGIPGNDDNFEFSIVNLEQSDLLNPDTEGSLNTSEIRIYEYKNGEYIEINKPNMDASRGYMIYESDIEFRMFLVIEAGVVVDDLIYKKSVIKWNELDRDTLELVLVHEPSNIQRLTKITFNNEEVWNEENSDDNIRYFKVVK